MRAQKMKVLVAQAYSLCRRRLKPAAAYCSFNLMIARTLPGINDYKSFISTKILLGWKNK